MANSRLDDDTKKGLLYFAIFIACFAALVGICAAIDYAVTSKTKPKPKPNLYPKTQL